MADQAEDQSIPKAGEVRRHVMGTVPDGIKLTLQRMAKYIIEAGHDPFVVMTARKIAHLAVSTARQLDLEVDDNTKPLIWLRGIHAWCWEFFEYVRDPLDVEMIQTPNRMLRQLIGPREVSRLMWEPIRDAMAKKEGVDPATLPFPTPKVTGDSDEAVILSMSLAAAIGITPLKIMLGGADKRIHLGQVITYAWGAVWAAEEWHHLDILHDTFGKHHTDLYEEYPIT